MYIILTREFTFGGLEFNFNVNSWINQSKVYGPSEWRQDIIVGKYFSEQQLK